MNRIFGLAGILTLVFIILTGLSGLMKWKLKLHKISGALALLFALLHAVIHFISE